MTPDQLTHAPSPAPAADPAAQPGARRTERPAITNVPVSHGLEEHLQWALSTSRIGWREIDVPSMVMTASPSCRENFGRNADEPFTYDDVVASIHPEDRPVVQASIAEAIRGRDEFRAAYRVTWRDGATRWIKALGRVVARDGGRPSRFLGTTQDVTDERRQSQIIADREAHFRALADSIPQLVWMAQADGFIVWYNQRWYDFTGTTPEQMAGWGWQSVHDPAELPRVLARWRRSIETGEPFEMEFPLRAAQGGFRWFLTRVTPVHDEQGSVVRWFGTNTDIHDQRITLDQLEATTRELARRTADAERARAEAEAANRAKSDFLAIMSHELRTPLNAIGGYAELIELGIHGPITEAQREAVARIQKSQRHLLGLINGVLNYARIETGSVHYARDMVHLEEVIATAEALVAPQARRRRLTLMTSRCPDDVTVHADHEKVQQILLNLLSNAVKFTEPGGRVAIDCHATADDVLLRVTDTGRGIAADKLTAIFEPFVQVDVRLTRTQEGVGLGLAISRDLARGMGGDISVESEVGTGSTFTLTLPRHQG